MKLLKFKHLDGYRFSLVFEEDRFPESDLKPLIGEEVDLSDLDTARIDEDWGCLEFKDGRIDIDPKPCIGSVSSNKSLLKYKVAR